MLLADTPILAPSTSSQAIFQKFLGPEGFRVCRVGGGVDLPERSKLFWIAALDTGGP